MPATKRSCIERVDTKAAKSSEIASLFPPSAWDDPLELGKSTIFILIISGLLLTIVGVLFGFAFSAKEFSTVFTNLAF